MNIKEFREVIKQREYVEEISSGEWEEGIEKCLKKEIEILSENIPSTIEFLNNECNAEEYSWISEVLEDVVEIVPSREFIQCYKALMTKFPEEYSAYKIAGVVERAQTILNWEETNGKKD